MSYKDNKMIIKSARCILKDGKITRKMKAANGNTMFQIGSISKTFTGTIIMMLVEKGKIKLDKGVNAYLKSWKCNKNVTLRQLLSHTSGHEPDQFDGVSYYPQKKIKQDRKLNVDRLSGELLSPPFKITKKPGTTFQYSNAGYQVVQQVIEDVTGKLLFDCYQSMIFKPLKMKNSTGKFLYKGKHEYPLADYGGKYQMISDTAAGGIWMSANDFMVFAKDLMLGYNENKSKLLKQDTIKAMTIGSHPEWNDFTKNFGMGVYEKEVNGMFSFNHNGATPNYQAKFRCIPEINYIEFAATNCEKYSKLSMIGLD